MTAEFFELLERFVRALESLAADVGYFADKARANDRREDPEPSPAPES